MTPLNSEKEKHLRAARRGWEVGRPEACRLGPPPIPLLRTRINKLIWSFGAASTWREKLFSKRTDLNVKRAILKRPSCQYTLFLFSNIRQHLANSLFLFFFPPRALQIVIVAIAKYSGSRLRYPNFKWDHSFAMHFFALRACQSILRFDSVPSSLQRRHV